MRAMCIVLFAALAIPVHATTVFKWVDAQGRIQYSDTPPPPNVKNVEQRRITPSTVESDAAPFAVREAAKRNPVTLWINDCGELCDTARDYLAKRGVPYAVRNPSREGEQEAWKKASGGDFKIPLLVIGTDKTLMGFNEDHWSAALEQAGYPRNAPAIKPQSIPPADPQVGLKPPAQQAPVAPGAPAEEAK